MFFFSSCCQNYETGEGYEVRQPTINYNRSPTFVQSLQEIDNETLKKQNNQIIKIKRSHYQQLIDSFKDTNKMWIDQEFPPQKNSLGDINMQGKWKRLSEIVQNPIIFSGKLSPSIMIADYLEQIFVQNPFYCTIAALLQHQEIIKNLFIGIQYSKAGLYKIPLRIDGQIEQIVIDDFLPVRANGIPIFSSSVSNQIWLYLLEKAWAKVNNGYTNINTSPRQIMRAFAWAPCEGISIKQSEQENKKLWQKLLNASAKKFPCVCQTALADGDKNDILDTGLLQGQFYTLIEAFNLEDQKGRLHQMLKMRSLINLNSCKVLIDKSNNLWGSIAQYQKDKNSNITEMRKQNIFYIRYQDFANFFSKIFLSYYEPKSNYLSQTLLSDLSKGFLYRFDVERECRYNIELHQPKILEQKIDQNQNQFKRGTILLIKDSKGQLSFIDGILTMTQKDTLLSAQLTPGKYVLYCKIDFNKQTPLSTQYSISIYSKLFVKFYKIQRNAYPNILQRTFLNFGRENPRNKHNNDLMWISYRLFYKQGGFAFIAMGNKSQSSKKYLITFDEKDFVKMNFKLKKPFKNIDSFQILEVLPGQEKIILARCSNNQNLRSLKFPPQLDIKIQPLDKR